MLGIATLAVLLMYEKTIERLVMQWPRCWGLIAYAEDKARAEKLDKIRRRLQQDKRMGKGMAPDWTAENPWNFCLGMLALDDEYWNEQVRHPAAAWTASGSRGAPMAPAEQAALAHVPGALDNMDVENELKDDGRRKQANRDKRAAKIRRIKASGRNLTSSGKWATC